MADPLQYFSERVRILADLLGKKQKNE